MSNAWSPQRDKDAAVVDWMREQGWPVTIAHYDFDLENFAWRHEAPSVSFALRISRQVLEDYTAAELVGHLNRLKVADLLDSNPMAYAVVKQDGVDVVLEVLPSPPKRRAK